MEKLVSEIFVWIYFFDMLAFNQSLSEPCGTVLHQPCLQKAIQTLLYLLLQSKSHWY
jgi:hypothetical protein